MSNGSGINDLWLTLLSDSTFTTSSAHHKNFAAFVYPNPANTRLVVDLTGANDEVFVNLVDLYGKIVMSKTL